MGRRLRRRALSNTKHPLRKNVKRSALLCEKKANAFMDAINFSGAIMLPRWVADPRRWVTKWMFRRHLKLIKTWEF